MSVPLLPALLLTVVEPASLTCNSGRSLPRILKSENERPKHMKVGIVGAGAMGRGIAQVSCEGGLDVVLFDVQHGAAAKAQAFIALMIERSVAKGTRTADQAEQVMARVAIAGSIEGLAGCDIIVEAIVEKLDAKQALFAQLDALCGPQTILASNTSSLPITAIAAYCKHPERVAGLHFDLAIFTQLTQDHLDYHLDLESYFQAKRRLFSEYHPKLCLLIAIARTVVDCR